VNFAAAAAEVAAPGFPPCCFAGGYRHASNIGRKEYVTPQFLHGKPGCLLTFTSTGF